MVISIKDVNSSKNTDYLTHVLTYFKTRYDLDCLDSHKPEYLRLIDAYYQLLSHVSITQFLHSERTQSVCLGGFLTISRATDDLHSQLEYSFQNNCGSYESGQLKGLLSSDPLLNADLYGQTRSEKKALSKLHTHLSDNLAKRIPLELLASPAFKDIYLCLFDMDCFLDVPNPIVLTTEQVKDFHRQYVLDVLKPHFFSENLFRLASHGINTSPVAHQIDVNPLRIISNCINMQFKYGLLGSNDEKNKYVAALEAWEKDNVNKLIFFRDLSQNGFDCLDQNYFSMDEVILKDSNTNRSIGKIRSTQIFSDRGVWREFLNAAPEKIYWILNTALHRTESHDNEDFLEKVFTDAFILQFCLRNKYEDITPFQIQYGKQLHMFGAFIKKVTSQLMPLDYARANRLYARLLQTLEVSRNYPVSCHHDPIKRYEDSEYANTLDYLCDKKTLPLDRRFTVKSLIAESKGWHNSIEQRKKRVCEFEYPELHVNVLFTRFEVIRNAEELRSEIETMDHCIASYSESMAERKYIAFRAIDTNSDWRGTVGLRIINCVPDPNDQDEWSMYQVYKFDQISGPKNTTCPSYLRIACESLIAKLMQEQPLADMVIQ